LSRRLRTSSISRPGPDGAMTPKNAKRGSAVKLPKDIRKDLESVLQEYEIAAIDGMTADARLRRYELLCADNLDNDPDDWAKHSLTLARSVRRLLTLGQTDAAVLVAIELGATGAYEECYSHRIWYRGERALEAGQKAAEAKWGPRQERQARRAELRRLFEQEAHKFTRAEDVYRAIAKQRGVSSRTVRRAVTGH
jgi:hypothetical protein